MTQLELIEERFNDAAGLAGGADAFMDHAPIDMAYLITTVKKLRSALYALEIASARALCYLESESQSPALLGVMKTMLGEAHRYAHVALMELKTERDTNETPSNNDNVSRPEEKQSS